MGNKERERTLRVEGRNLSAIEKLNQRGGRSLSIVDLIEAGTVTAEMAAFCWTAVQAGASFMTGAVPGGAGKTTLMAALLAFLPAGEAIITTFDRRVIRQALSGSIPMPVTLLAHEIGSGPWFGYIWGPAAAEFFRASGRRGVRCVTCLHADDPTQAWQILEPLGVDEGSFARVKLQLYMTMQGRPGHRVRRVSSLYYTVDGCPACAYCFSAGGSGFKRRMHRGELCSALAADSGMGCSQLEQLWCERTDFLAALQDEGLSDYRDVRSRLLASASGV